jgi:hypothetical protein
MGAGMNSATWARVFGEAAGLGVLQVHLSGGRAASRRDLVDIMAAARNAGLYTNLITSGVGRRLERPHVFLRQRPQFSPPRRLLQHRVGWEQSCTSIERQKGVENASQNICCAGRRVDRRTRVGN